MCVREAELAHAVGPLSGTGHVAKQLKRERGRKEEWSEGGKGMKRTVKKWERESGNWNVVFRGKANVSFDSRRQIELNQVIFKTVT